MIVLTEFPIENKFIRIVGHWILGNLCSLNVLQEITLIFKTKFTLCKKMTNFGMDTVQGY